MESGNNTQILEFLLRFSEDPEFQPHFFSLFLSMYLVNCTGNLLIILTIISDSHLHLPVYFFLSSLSLCDICSTSTLVPKMLVNIQTESKVVTYESCLTQMYFFILFVGLNDFLLAMMAYDCYMAICHSLHYMVIMNPQLCILLVLGTLIMSVLHSLLQGLMMLWLSFCTHIEIPQFFCELNDMAQLSCSDTYINDIVMYFTVVVLAGGLLVGLLFSYSKIVSSISAISSPLGIYKVFSTCASHLSVVSFYCTSLGVYLSPAGSHNTYLSAVASLMYIVVILMRNPFIYSLRNKDTKGALKRFLWREARKVSLFLERN